MKHGLRALCFSLLACAPVTAQFELGSIGNGSSLVGRAGNRPGQRGTEWVNMNYSLGLTGNYDDGLLPLQLTSDGKFENVTLQGGSLEANVFGSKQWKRTLLGIDYKGSYAKYNRKTLLDGANQLLGLTVERRLSRRFALVLTEGAGTSTRTNGSFGASVYASPASLGVPLAEVFDSRFYYADTGATMRYQYSRRTTFSASGNVFVVSRVAKQLADTRGAMVSGNVQRTLDRNTIVRGEYQFIHFTFPPSFGATDAHVAQGGITRKFGRRIEVGLFGGVARAESLGQQRVNLDPEIAAILGRSTGDRAIYRINYVPQGNGNVRYTLRHSSFYLSYSQGLNPGNGIYLTSNAQTSTMGYSYGGIRRLSVGGTLGRSQFNSVFVNISKYTSWGGGVYATYALTDHWQMNLSTDTRRFTAGTLQNRTLNHVSFGINYSGNSLPIGNW